MAVIHNWECAAHGGFEARGTPSKPPKCPKGCSASFVSLVFTQPPAFGSARVRRADRLLREAADMQGLSDISTSPSRPGGSVAYRNQMRLMGPKDRPELQYPQMAAAQPVEIGKYIQAATHKESALQRLGFGHKYDPAEWRRDPETGTLRHLAPQPAIQEKPLGSTGVSIERVRE